MYPPEPRAHGVVTLTLLDLDALSTQALEAWRRERPDTNYIRMEPGFAPYAATEHDGTLYVICNEGVGWEVTDTNPLPLDLYGRAEHSFSMAPNMRATLSPDEVRSLMTGDTVDLADHVRRFGDRLEVNFETWLGRLS